MKYTFLSLSLIAALCCTPKYREPKSVEKVQCTTVGQIVTIYQPVQYKSEKLDSTFRVFVSSDVTKSHILGKYEDIILGYSTSFTRDNSQQSGYYQEWTIVFPLGKKKEIMGFLWKL